MEDARREAIMTQWDYWRKRIAEGDKSSEPRDWFESLLEELEGGGVVRLWGYIDNSN